jgi:hypothetical protein
LITIFTLIGTNIDYKGWFNDGVEILAKKASKAMFALIKTINSNNLNPIVALRLFKWFEGYVACKNKLI